VAFTIVILIWLLFLPVVFLLSFSLVLFSAFTLLL
jgi:hypothetical protein